MRRPRVLKLQRREIGYYVTYGVIGIGLFNLAFNTSVAVNKASVATALMFCAPVFVALGSWWVFTNGCGHCQCWRWSSICSDLHWSALFQHCLPGQPET